MLVPYYSPYHVMLLYFCILNLVNSYIVKSRFESTALVMLTDASCFRGRQDTNTSQSSLDWGNEKERKFLQSNQMTSCIAQLKSMLHRRLLPLGA